MRVQGDIIQQYTVEIRLDYKFGMKEIIFIIIQTVWIQEALNCIVKSFDKRILEELKK